MAKRCVKDSVKPYLGQGAYNYGNALFVKYEINNGILTDEKGQPILGASIEAIEQNSSQRKFSITNEAGVYYLEGLVQGRYTVQINGVQSRNSLSLDGNSEPLQELNLKMPQTLTQ